MQPSSTQKIQMLNNMNISTREEAVAYLRTAQQALNQIANIIGNDMRRDLADYNRKVAEENKPEAQQKQAQRFVAQEVEEPKNVIEPTEFIDEEEHSDEEKEARKEALKKVKKTKKTEKANKTEEA